MPRNEDFTAQLSAQQLQAFKDEIKDEIAAEMGLVRADGHENFSEFSTWWQSKKQRTDRVIRAGVQVLTTLIIAVIVAVATFIAQNVKWNGG